jgi:hypothetical protein
LAGNFYKLELLKQIMNWAKENVRRALVNKLLFATDNKGRTVWQVALCCGKINSLQKIWN